jgi:hypothetical protein
VADLLATFAVCPVDHAVLQAALAKPMPDYEDAVLEAAADRAGIPVIVTRNQADFAGAARRVIDAATLVSELDQAPPGP